MVDVNKINLDDTYMRYIMTINAQTMALIQILIDRGIVTEEEVDERVTSAMLAINENIEENKNRYKAGDNIETNETKRHDDA